MKTLLAIAAVCAMVCAGPSLAADTKSTDSKATNSQQDKMKSCNAEAGDKKGDERKAFMKTCLSAAPPAPAKPESKMAMCNKKTAGMAKEERSKAQSECMKAS